MKIFQLTISIANFVIFRQNYGFNDDKEKEFLQAIIEKPNDYFKNELKAIIYEAGLPQGEEDVFITFSENFFLEFVKKYPDMVIQAGIRARVFENHPFSGFVNFVDNQVAGMKQYKVKSSKEVWEIENYSWSCHRVI